MKPDVTTSTWNTALFELVTGKSHRVHPCDATRPLGERFAGEAMILVMLAKEKAATVRITFDPQGKPHIGETRQIAGRGQGELARVIQAEARTTGARWGIAVFALGWQAILGTRSSRPGPEGNSFERFRLPLEQPELFCAHPQEEAIYSTVDHPTLDRSVVFCLRRKDVEEVLQDFRTANLGVASIRVGVAAQLESWMTARGPEATGQDILVTDGLSVLFLQIENGEFRAPPGSTTAADARPRQAAARPGETVTDITRFLKDQGRGSVCFLGAAEMAAAAQAGAGDTPIELQRAPEGAWHDAISSALAAGVLHDFNPDLREQRQPLSQSWRKYVLAGLVAAVTMLLAIGINLWQVVRSDWAREMHLEEASRQRLRCEQANNALAGIQKERQQAQRLRQWIAHNYHAQPLAHEMLRKLPPEVGLERLAAHLEEGNAQMTLEFTLLGDDAAQVAATRALERAVIEQDLQIGERHPATAMSGGMTYRWRLLLPGGDWESDGGGWKPRTEGERLWANDPPSGNAMPPGPKLGPINKRKG